MGRELLLRWIPWGNRALDRHRFPDGTEVLLYRPTIEFAAEAVAAHDARIDSMVNDLEKLRDLVAHHDAVLLVMLIPSKEELFGVNASARDLNIVSRTRQRLEERKFLVLDLYPAIQQGGARQSPYFIRDIHLNEYGNGIVAEQFVAWFHSLTMGTKSMK
jgi:hypothetical protein